MKDDERAISGLGSDPGPLDLEDFTLRMMGDPTLVQEVARTAEHELRGLLADLDRATQNVDATALRRVTHAMKGAFANVSARHATRMAEEAEQSAKGMAGDIEQRCVLLRVAAEAALADLADLGRGAA